MSTRLSDSQLGVLEAKKEKKYLMLILKIFVGIRLLSLSLSMFFVTAWQQEYAIF